MCKNDPNQVLVLMKVGPDGHLRWLRGYFLLMLYRYNNPLYQEKELNTSCVSSSVAGVPTTLVQGNPNILGVSIARKPINVTKMVASSYKGHKVGINEI
jgi:hypothetical protein